MQTYVKAAVHLNSVSTYDITWKCVVSSMPRPLDRRGEREPTAPIDEMGKP
jgi:hypothetical protein